MKYYIETTLIPSADISLFFLWEKIFYQIHLGLVEIQNDYNVCPIGISFPEYNIKKFHLGTKLRLFSSEETTLDKFSIEKWLNRLTDYVHFTRVRPVPKHVNQYACFKRQQPKSSKTRLARRKVKREGIDFKEALEKIEPFTDKKVDTPFINIKSTSSQKRFRLFILKEKNEKFVNEGFSSFGLSSVSTVPDF